MSESYRAASGSYWSQTLLLDT